MADFLPKPVRKRKNHIRYLITFACYGGHLHGEEPGSVDLRHNLPGSRLLEADPQRATAERERMNQAPYYLNQDRRAAVLEAIREVCRHQGWGLLAAHVRTNHAHVVLEAEVRPEKVLNHFKAHASRGLNRLGCDAPDRRRWARHGSTRWLWKDQEVQEAIRYVVEGQGDTMAIFVADVV